MTALPVIVGMGGINAAGRTSFHQGYRRIVLDSLDAKARQETFLGLATLMNLVTLTEGLLKDADGNTIAESDIEAKFGEQILAGTLIRKIEKNHFDVDATPWQQKMTLTASDEQQIVFETRRRDLPTPVPSAWQVEELTDKKVKVTISADLAIKHDSTRDNPIKAAGQLPTGFEPSAMYNSRYQPRGLQATIFAATDAIRSTGLPWQQVMNSVEPDQIGTYSASVAGQVDDEGFGGLIRARQQGDRVYTKHIQKYLFCRSNLFGVDRNRLFILRLLNLQFVNDWIGCFGSVRFALFMSSVCFGRGRSSEFSFFGF